MSSLVVYDYGAAKQCICGNGFVLFDDTSLMGRTSPNKAALVIVQVSVTM